MVKIVILSLFLPYIVSCASELTYFPKSYFIKVPDAIPKGELKVQFLGTSGLYFTDDNDAILFDGFLTRPSKTSMLFCGMRSDPDTVTSTLRRLSIQKAKYVFVSHSHYDHALDGDITANALEAELVGSITTLSLNSSANKTKVVSVGTPHLTKDREAFQVSSLPSPHVKKVWYKRLIEILISIPSCGWGYLDDGGSYSFYIEHPQANILVLPSAAAPDSLPSSISPEIIFMSIGLLNDRSDEYLENYWRSVVVRKDPKGKVPKWVIPVHWDDFSRPLGSSLPLPPAWIDNPQQALERLQRIACQVSGEDGPKIVLPPPEKPFSVVSITADNQILNTCD